MAQLRDRLPVFIGVALLLFTIDGEAQLVDSERFLCSEACADFNLTEPEGRFGAALAVGDFNGDGRDDLVVGEPGVTDGGPSGGQVRVFYADENGIANDGPSETISQNSPDITGNSEAGDQFGASVAAGDVNGDGFDDLIIGVPREALNSNDVLQENAGAIHVIYGSANGLTSSGSQFFSQAGEIVGALEADDQFGHAVVTGNFNGDEYADVAIGIVNEDIGGVSNAGGVNVLYGSASGLSTNGNQGWDQTRFPGLGGVVPQQNDNFGHALAAGDLNGDGFDELLIGVPGDDISVNSDGSVFVLNGSASGLLASLPFHQTLPDVDGTPAEFDLFGRAIAVGDFDGDRRADFAAGVPFNDNAFGFDRGAVNVFFDKANASQSILLDWAWGNDTGMFFGDALAAGDFDGDGRDDLAIGLPAGDEIYIKDPRDITALDGGEVNNSGGVVIYYSATRNAPNFEQDQNSQAWHQSVPVGGNNRRFAQGAADPSDNFGTSLAVGDFNSDGIDDLAIGVPGENPSEFARPGVDAGVVNILYGQRWSSPVAFSEDFSSRRPLPKRLEFSSCCGPVSFINAALEFQGVGDAGRRYMRTLSGRYHTVSFAAEITIEVSEGAGGASAGFFGFGTGQADSEFFNEPLTAPSAYVALFASDFGDGEAFYRDSTGENFSLFPTGTGRHRVRLDWDHLERRLVLDIDRSWNGGGFFSDLRRIFDDFILDFGDEGGHLFFGGAEGVTFDDLKVTVGEAIFRDRFE